MSRKRYKKMTTDEFIVVAERPWVPIKLVGSAKPNWMLGIPEEKLGLILISGSFIDPRIVEANGITYSGVVGGMDIYRYDEKDVDKGYPFNKDHYIIFHDRASDDALLVAGPVNKKDDHWFAELPKLEPKIDVFEFRGIVLDINDDD